jgi:hypothetical protein
VFSAAVSSEFPMTTIPGTPWLPRSLGHVGTPVFDRVERGELWYVVVDELDPGVAVLVVSRWPRVDGSGRLRFQQEADVQLAVDAAGFQEPLGQRLPSGEPEAPATDEELRRRPLQVGDVFAAALSEVPSEDIETPGDPKRWFGSTIIDLSGEAREAAKVQFYAAVSHVLTEDELDAIVSEMRGEGPTSPEGGPEGEGGPENEGGPGEGGPAEPEPRQPSPGTEAVPIEREPERTRAVSH